MTTTGKRTGRDGAILAAASIPTQPTPAQATSRRTSRRTSVPAALGCEDGSFRRVQGSEPVIADLRDHRHELVALCRQFGVRRLEVFGSATSEEFDPVCSDIDFLVEFDPPEGSSRFDAFFGLKEAFEALLGHPVDLVDPSALDNPYFAEMVEQTRRELYAA